MRQKTQGVIGLDSMGYCAVIKFSAALTDITLPAFAAEQETE